MNKYSHLTCPDDFYPGLPPWSIDELRRGYDEQPKPMEAVEAPELARVKPRVEDIVLLHALQKGDYQAATQIMNARIKLSPLVVAELHKPGVAEGILEAALREKYPNAINALIVVEAFPRKKWQEMFDKCVAFMGYPDSDKHLSTLLKTHAIGFIDLNRKYKESTMGGLTTALSNAARWRLPNMVQVLLNAGAGINEQDSDGNTPIMQAFSHGKQNHAHQEVIKLFLARPNIDLELKNKRGFTALAEAVRVYDLFAVTELLAKGARVNVQNCEGVSPLIYATWFEDATIARLLLERGADVSLKDCGGITALDWSQKSKYKEIRALIPLIEARMREQAKANE